MTASSTGTQLAADSLIPKALLFAAAAISTLNLALVLTQIPILQSTNWVLLFAKLVLDSSYAQQSEFLQSLHFIAGDCSSYLAST